VLAGWKAQREVEASIDIAALAALTDERLMAMIEQAVAAAGPRRQLTVELGLGVAAPGQTITFPAESASDFSGMYADLGPAILTLTVRSVGGLRAFVNSYELRLVPSNDRLMGINDFPRINPSIPCPVEIGESQTWLYDLHGLTGLIGGLQKVRGPVTAVVGQADLGSGETLTSAELPVELLGQLSG
jgi:hypothetical protein